VDHGRVQQVGQPDVPAGVQEAAHAGTDTGSIRLERAAGERQGGDQQLAGG
jgi:hypothetical protein